MNKIGINSYDIAIVLYKKFCKLLKCLGRDIIFTKVPALVIG